MYTLSVVAPQYELSILPSNIFTHITDIFQRLAIKTTVQAQNAVTIVFENKHLLLFTFDVQKRQTVITAYFTSKQLLWFPFALHCIAMTNSSNCLLEL